MSQVSLRQIRMSGFVVADSVFGLPAGVSVRGWGRWEGRWWVVCVGRVRVLAWARRPAPRSAQVLMSAVWCGSGSLGSLGQDKVGDGPIGADLTDGTDGPSAAGGVGDGPRCRRVECVDEMVDVAAHRRRQLQRGVGAREQGHGIQFRIKRPKDSLDCWSVSAS